MRVGAILEESHRHHPYCPNDHGPLFLLLTHQHYPGVNQSERGLVSGALQASSRTGFVNLRTTRAPAFFLRQDLSISPPPSFQHRLSRRQRPILHCTMPAELHSIYDLTTHSKATTGDVPQKLVGASTTVVGSKMYLFGGRLVAERRMVNDLYVFDLETYNWERITPFPEDDVPRARYFHSVDTWNNQLIVFGGMSNEPDSPNPDELCVLNDVRFFDIASRHWLPQSRLATPENLIPRARYAQLSSVTGDRLFIIGGQDFYNTWLDDICVYDLLAKTWSEKRDYPRHCGSYRSVAVSSNMCVRFPKEELWTSKLPNPLGPSGSRFQTPNSPPTDDTTGSESLSHLPYSAPPDDEHPSDIYLYSNYNFTDVKRELEVFSPLPDTGFTIDDRSAAMSGSTFPPGLRFPTGAILGTHLIIAGIYLAHSYQSFSIWVLDLQTMVWSRIDPGKAVESGSWFRGCLWPEQNKFLIFGNRNGNLVDDYNRRLLSWDHVAVVDLEAFGIYQPPALRLDIPMQELGLSALEEGVLSDFEIVCDDGRKIGCSRKLLEDRWPWFKEQRLKLLQSAMNALESLPSSPMHIPLPDLPGNVPDDERPDPRLTPRAFNLSEPYPITLALLQYFYSMALLTPLQTAPAVLSQLLVLATNYQITHLQSLAKHAMHRALSNSTSVGVYEVATLCSCRSLQIRALKTVMSYTQKKPTRTRNDNGGGGGGGRPDGGGGGGGGGGPRTNGGGPGSDSQFNTRPRGTSDARWGDTTRGGPYSNYPVGTSYRDDIIEDADQLFTLPVFDKSVRHKRTESVVSIRTEEEIQELMAFMAPVAPTPPRSPRMSEQMLMDQIYESAMSHPYAPSFIYEDDEEDEETDEGYYPSSSQGSVSISVEESESEEAAVSAPPTPSRLASSKVMAYHLPRRIDTRKSATPSLVSSISTSSSSHASGSYFGPLTPPLSPQVSSAHALEMIEEQEQHYADEESDSFDVDPVQSIRSHNRSDQTPTIPWSAPPAKTRFEWGSPVDMKITEVTRTDELSRPRTMSPSPSETETVSAGATGARHSLSGNAFSRILARKSTSGPISSPMGKSPLSPPSHLFLDEKSQRAEEKRLKKEADRLRKEELALKLRQGARKAKDDSDRSSSKSKEKYLEPIAMYGGVFRGNLTL
ncbi:hypothetical protein MIND_00834400 [Mycena indigotica]|uniref:Regulatory protein ral2 n=1 Tax=Mycena indigotica TaxID=2126181 RepID=A0A8H6SG32_9AGAR|nr:uncharacterized protein MIND_00834400 [Mycena indigotica]KAF7298866.1 hypothetical protein MIND_00834400 [Mycena indigotica]